MNELDRKVSGFKQQIANLERNLNHNKEQLSALKDAEMVESRAVLKILAQIPETMDPCSFQGISFDFSEDLKDKNQRGVQACIVTHSNYYFTDAQKNQIRLYLEDVFSCRKTTFSMYPLKKEKDE